MDVYLSKNGCIEVRPPVEIEGRFLTESIFRGVESYTNRDGESITYPAYTTREWLLIVPRANGNGVQVFKETG